MNDLDYKDETLWLMKGDCLARMKEIPDNSVDAIVTDPAYETKESDMIEVISKWLTDKDYNCKSFLPSPSIWKECFRVLKPGSHVIVFFDTQNYDMGTLAVRLAGFEIRDQLAWIFDAGYVPILLARKPLIGTVVQNVLKHGTGAINIDGCRVAAGSDHAKNCNRTSVKSHWNNSEGRSSVEASALGRWPANFLHDGSDEVTKLFPQSVARPIKPENLKASGNKKRGMFGKSAVQSGYYDTEKNAARFFYCAKVTKSDQNDTKPHELMKWLARLITPTGGVILDPFLGSGSTGKASVVEGFNFIGIEMDNFDIAKNRILKLI